MARRLSGFGEAVAEIGGEEVRLLPERAMYWPRARTLIVADTHWGKAASYRAASVAVPRGTTESDLARLTVCLRRTSARRLLILGDALHAKTGRAPATLAAVGRWRATHGDLAITLVRGNHDRHAGDPPPDWGFDVIDQPLVEGAFRFCHEPSAQAGLYTLAGHVHPAVRLYGAGGETERLPCFHLGRQVGVLPACGSLTGCATVRPVRGDRVWVVAGDEVVGVSEEF